MKNKKNSFRLSSKLFSAILGASLFIGFVLTGFQIWLDYQRTQRDIARLGPDVAHILQYPTLEAAYRLDKVMARRVLEAAFVRPYLTSARIRSDSGMLAELSRDPRPLALRGLSTRLFGADLHHETVLDSTMTGEQDALGRPRQVYGSLELVIDPAPPGLEFLNRAMLAMLAGLLQSVGFALLLYAIIHGLITRPLEGLIRSLGDIDPRKPGKHKLQAPEGHEHDELGIWVDTCNRLLEAVEEYNRQRRLAEANVERLSNYDSLTELPNRSLLLKQLETLEGAREEGLDTALLYLGLDDFSSVNLLHSYRAGDRVLVQLAARLRKALPETALLSRVGGDQFCAVLRGADDQEARRIASQLVKVAHAPFEIHDQQLQLSATVGIACFPRDAMTPELLLKNAEQVMLLGKSTGGSSVSIYSEMADQRQRAAKQLEKDLLGAVVNQQLQLMFQPQVDLRTGQISGFEALLRWNHPTRGRVSPDEFIQMAEANRAVIPIGRWVLETACRMLARWTDAGFGHVGMSVNLSTVQLHHTGMLDDLERILGQHGLPSGSLTLEITETAVMEDLESSIGVLKDIHALGVRLAVDDFGTGYSSLSYLRRMPIDEVKLDRSFLAEANLQGNGIKIVESIIHLSHTLGLDVIAEGTETPDQVTLLQKCHCNRAQGYYFSEPVGEQDVLPLLRGDARLRHPLLAHEPAPLDAPSVTDA
jgi:diguanylate cyclase (GGDEF)-like protein